MRAPRDALALLTFLVGCLAGCDGRSEENPACELPKGTFAVRFQLDEASAGCPDDVTLSFEKEWEFTEVGSDSVDNCVRTLGWAKAPGCQLEATESCLDGRDTRWRAPIDQGDDASFEIRATQSRPGCTIQYNGVALRAKRDPTSPREDSAIEDASLTDGSVKDGGTRDGGPNDSGRPTPADPGTFDGTIVAAAMQESVGGFPVPIWLYRGGLFPTQPRDLLPIPAQAIRYHTSNPDLWRAWRRTALGVETQNAKKEWTALPYDDEYAPLKAGTAIVGTYVDIGYSLVHKYRFARDGSFEWCEFVALTLSGERSSGTYEVDGYVITLRHKGGKRETFSLVHDPVSRPNSLWIDQANYSRDNQGSTSGPIVCD